MSNNKNQIFSTLTEAKSVNEGLRKYMLSIYNFMTIALSISSLVALVAAKTGLALAIFSSPLGIVASFAPLAFSIYMSVKFHNMSFEQVRNALFVYATLMGLSLSTIFLVFNVREITVAFLSSASMFAGMSLYGYTTKKDLSSWGSILSMLVWGLIISSVLNIFMRSGQFAFLISFISVIVFTGLVAYDTQKLKKLYYLLTNSNMDTNKIAVYGALQLYMDFVIIFVHTLNLLRNRD